MKDDTDISNNKIEFSEKGISLLAKDVRDNLIGIILLVLYCVIMHFAFNYVCPFRLLTGIPCPGCGLSRAGLALITLHFDRVVFYNPVIIPIAIYAIYYSVCRYVLGKNVRHQTAFILLLAVLLFALYFYRITTMFPDHRPMEYMPRNLFSPIYRFIHKYILQINTLFG